MAFISKLQENQRIHILYMTEEEILEKLNKSRESASKGNYKSAKETISSLKKHEL